MGDGPAVPDGGGPESVPRADDLERIPPDPWAWLLPHLRDALHAVDEEQVRDLGRLRATPAVRLAGGRPRREIARILSRGGPLWLALRERIAAAGDRPPSLDWLVTGRRAAAPPPSTAPATPRVPDRQAEARLRERAQRLRRERDDARRRLEGSEARAAAAEQRASELGDQLRRAEEEVRGLEERLAAAAADREQALERERRRGAAELAALREELSALRRAEQERLAEARRRVEAPATPTPRPARAPRGSGPGRLVPGRPSRLPPGVRRGTREAVEALLHRDRFVLVDGYNVTRTQRDDLDLDQQRRWLVRGLATQVARRGIRATVVFDSGVAGPGGRRETARGVTVRYTAEGMTADDEIVFEVAAQEPDAPVLVVTDDRGLRERLTPYRVDLVGTAELRWVLD